MQSPVNLTIQNTHKKLPWQTCSYKLNFSGKHSASLLLLRDKQFVHIIHNWGSLDDLVAKTSTGNPKVAGSSPS